MYFYWHLAERVRKIKLIFQENVSLRGFSHPLKNVLHRPKPRTFSNLFQHNVGQNLYNNRPTQWKRSFEGDTTGNIFQATSYFSSSSTCFLLLKNLLMKNPSVDLTSQGAQKRISPGGRPSSYYPSPTGHCFNKQMGTSVFQLRLHVRRGRLRHKITIILQCFQEWAKTIPRSGNFPKVV